MADIVEKAKEVLKNHFAYSSIPMPLFAELIGELEKLRDKEADLHNAHYANTFKIESLKKKIEKLEAEALSKTTDYDLLVDKHRETQGEVENHKAMIFLWEKRNLLSVTEIEGLREGSHYTSDLYDQAMSELKKVTSENESLTKERDMYKSNDLRRIELMEKLEASEKKVEELNPFMADCQTCDLGYTTRDHRKECRRKMTHTPTTGGIK